MRLTKEETEMLEGKYGYPVQKSMEILVGLGECYGADKMIPVTSAHILADWTVHRKAGALFVEEMAEKGGKCVIHTDDNPWSLGPWAWKDKGIPEEFANWQLKIHNAHVKMGVFVCHTCTPYYIGNVPRKGEHVAWSESSAVPVANSILGARTNREGGGASLAAALTGRVANYGFHLDQNRYGNLKILVTAKLNGSHDYGTLGYFIGRVAPDGIPVLVGIPSSVPTESLVQMGASAASSGSVAHYHIVGVTPEAPTEEAAFGPKKAKDWQTFEFGEKELRETEELLSPATSREVELVVFGCPHASIGEIREITQLLSGKRLKSGVELWIWTSQIVRAYAEIMGYLDIIEASGARIVCETCVVSAPEGYLKKRGIKTVATNSAKISHYIKTAQDVMPYCGSTERCVEAATSGIWR
ncbi:hypothetical protein ES708_02430 [subsurface metagenome]